MPEGGGWAEHVLHSFQDNGDGGETRSGLTFDSKGNLYGTASGGGASGAGTVFRLRPQTDGSWIFESIYQFGVSPDGSYPTGDLILGSAGNLYGTTLYGGSGQLVAITAAARCLRFRRKVLPVLQQRSAGEY